jgi:hypothetical protein
MNPVLPVHRWTVQPPSGDIDRGDPLFDGLIYATYMTANDARRPPYNYAANPIGNALGSMTSANFGAFAQTIAPNFNGSTEYASQAIDLSPYKQITVSLRFWIDPSATGTQLLLEYTPNYNSPNSGFLIYQQVGSYFDCALSQAGVFYEFQCAEPNGLGRQHTVSAPMDRNSVAAPVSVYLDGVASARTGGGASSIGGSFDNSSLYYAARGGSSVFSKVRIANVLIHKRLLSQGECQRLHLAPWDVMQPRIGLRRLWLVNKIISGQVTLSGAPVVGCVVNIYLRSTGAFLKTTTTDGSGNYSFGGLGDAASAYEVVAIDATNTYNMGRLDRMSAG